jgi:hypothetical protein
MLADLNMRSPLGSFSGTSHWRASIDGRASHRRSCDSERPRRRVFAIAARD